MLKAIRTGKIPFQKHLSECSDCRRQFETFQRYDGSEDLSGDQMPEGLVQRLNAIPDILAARRPSRVVAGEIAHDSWSGVSRAQLRDGSQGLERRMRLSWDNIHLELVAERRTRGWEFTARIYEDNRVSSQYVLRVGKRELLPGTQSCYCWSSSRPPRRLCLQSAEIAIEFGGIVWSKTS